MGGEKAETSQVHSQYPATKRLKCFTFRQGCRTAACTFSCPSLLCLLHSWDKGYMVGVSIAILEHEAILRVKATAKGWLSRAIEGDWILDGQGATMPTLAYCTRLLLHERNKLISWLRFCYLYLCYQITQFLRYIQDNKIYCNTIIIKPGIA